MTTESDAVLATIVDNWGGGGYGGATPKIQSTSDISVDRWAALDAVIVLHDTLDELHPPVNDNFVNKEYTMDIRVTSITTEDQLKLLVEETEYLLNNTAITGFTSVRVYRKNRGSSDRGRKVYRNDISIRFYAVMSSSAVAPTGGVGSGLTGAYIEDLLMWTSTNAAWVPMALMGGGLHTNYRFLVGRMINLGADDYTVSYLIPLPTVKGSLKLYIKSIKYGVFDADDSDYITTVEIHGMNEADANVTIDSDTTDHKTAGDKTFSGATFPAAVIDTSAYQSVLIQVSVFSTTAGEFDFSNVRAQCYYDT